jgi:hypothetical protein
MIFPCDVDTAIFIDFIDVALSTATISVSITFSSTLIDELYIAN